MTDLRLGRWQDALADVAHVDAVICDPPYSARTHASAPTRSDDSDDDGAAPKYAPWTSYEVCEFLRHWSPRCDGWIVCLTDHVLIPAYELAAKEVGRLCFAPVPCVIRGMSVRLQGDGPSSWTVYAMVMRPREKRFLSWGTLPGAYVEGAQPGAGGGRGKPQWLMRALVEHYSRPGDLVCDPVAGWGSTAIACESMRRRFVGAEMDQAAWEEAMRRVNKPQQIDMWAGEVAS